jgi:hypothetical protein
MVHLGDVVADVIDDIHVQVVGGLLEELGEGLAAQECHGAAVDPRIVGRTCHRLQWDGKVRK